MPQTAFVLLGPTASGKSRLALELAEKLPLEIVVMDSAQVYRGMDIGTAKPAAAERAKVPHHLIDLVDPDQSYSVGRWRSEAIQTTNEILARNKLPLIVGGTMLYYRALTSGLANMPSADPELRAELDLSAARRGWPSLHAELAKVDPEAAQRIQPNDAQMLSGDRVEVTWPSTAGKTYRLLASTDGRTWQSYGGEIRTTGTQGSYTFTSGGGFFLFKVELIP